MDIVDDRYPQLRARSTGPLRVQELALLLAELGGMEAFMGVGVSPPPSGTTEEHADDGDVRRDGEGKWTTSSNKGGGGESAETEGELEGADAGDSAMDTDSSDDDVAEAEPLRVLVVDDDVLTCKIVSSMLRACGYDVLVATNGREAMEVVEAEEGRVDVVLTDVLMPEVSGFELLINILQQPRFSHIAIILMSSSTTDDMVLRAQEAGAADFLCKPVRREEMFELRRHAKGDRRGREGREGKEESRRTSLPEQPPKEDRAVDDGGVSGQRLLPRALLELSMIGAERERLRIGGDAPPAAPAASLGQALGASAFHPFATLVPRPVPRPDEPKRQRRDPPASGTAPTVSATRRDLSPPRRPSTRSRGLSAGRSGQGDGGREQARQGGEASREGDRRASVCGEGAAEQEQFVVAFHEALRQGRPLPPGFQGRSPKSAAAAAARLAALARFREKKKKRTFQKKVRYESRKKLAEQRPRIRGQFVKQEVAAALAAVELASGR